MSIRHVVRDRDPALTCRRILLVINALGDAVPQKIIDWIVTTVEGSDGDILRVRAFALAACDVRAEDTRVSPSEAVATIREICARRLNS